jgi:3-oxoacyl-[acyl-carrier-protein] synthase II
MLRKVVVTGVGPISSIGTGKDKFWESAREGKGYFRNVSFPDVDIEQFRSRVCSPVEDFEPGSHIEKVKALKRAGRATKFSVVGTYLALVDAGFRIQAVDREELGKPKHYCVEGLNPYCTGVILGQAVTNVDIEYPEHCKFIADHGPKRVNPFTLPESNSNRGAAAVAEWFYLKGTGLTVSTACASATHAIGIAALHIQAGIEDVMITGGAEAAIDPYVFSGFDIMKALSTRNSDPMGASRPFDKERDGFVLGEGAGIIVLEELEHARRRNARIYAEIAGYGFSQDAFHLVVPDPTGAAAIQAINKALSTAKLAPEEIEYINAHGTGTLLNDPNESYIIKAVFKDYAYKIPISSSKSYFGHPLGATGGLESIVTLLIMEKGVIAPTANLENPDVDFVDRTLPHFDKRCDLDYVPKVKRVKDVRTALSESFGFGGQNSVVVFRKLDG